MLNLLKVNSDKVFLCLEPCCLLVHRAGQKAAWWKEGHRGPGKHGISSQRSMTRQYTCLELRLFSHWGRNCEKKGKRMSKDTPVPKEGLIQNQRTGTAIKTLPITLTCTWLALALFLCHTQTQTQTHTHTHIIAAEWEHRSLASSHAFHSSITEWQWWGGLLGPQNPSKIV